MRRLTTALCAAFVVLCAQGCATVKPDVIMPIVMVPMQSTKISPLDLAVRVVSVRGRLVAKSGAETPHQRTAGSVITGLTGVRVSGDGAVLLLGSEARPQGKLWLRGGAQLRLGRAENGALRLHVQHGDIRVSMFTVSPRVEVLNGRSLLIVSGRDVLVHGDSKTNTTTVVPTIANLDGADWALRLESAPQPQGVGNLATRDPSGSVVHLQLRTLRVSGRVVGEMVETTVEHIFHNPSKQQLEGTFRFPVPQGAIVTGLAMEINGKLMEGELLERSRAREIYNEIVDAMQDPALLEWEKGNVFKLRVFPIEPEREKRVVLRYIAPLTRSGSGLVFSYSASAPAMQTAIGRFTLTLDGKTIHDATDFAAGRTIQVPITAIRRGGLAYQERFQDGVYTAVRIQPDWSQFARRQGPLKQRARRVVFVFDSSRSGLESRALALQSLRILLADLRPNDRFVVLAADLVVRRHWTTFVYATDNNKQRALRFVEGIDPDGASDLGAAFSAAAALAHAPKIVNRDGRDQIVYIGDGTPTWGVTDHKALRSLAQSQFDKTPFFALVLGRRKEPELLKRIAQASGGWIATPDTDLAVRRFAMRLVNRDGVPCLSGLTISAGEKDAIYPAGPRVLFQGADLVVVVRTPRGLPAPATLLLRARLNGKQVSQTLVVPAPRVVGHVAKRWARYHIASMQSEGKPKALIVKSSLKYQVMSKHTAFLVLESEAAYKKYKIARKNANQQRKIRISGADLESVGSRNPQLTPDNFQPGDPEVRIPAPRDVRSVVVVFPFGDTKVAVWEPALRMWTVRFLVDKDTPDGMYIVRVRVTHSSGRVELLKLSYKVDTLRPTVQMRLVVVPGRPGLYRIEARQKVTRSELKQLGLHNTTRLSQRDAVLVSDARRVEVRLPDGRILRLWRAGHGKFARNWRPRRALRGPLKLRVVACDKAKNQQVRVFTVSPHSARWSDHD